MDLLNTKSLYFVRLVILSKSLISSKMVMGKEVTRPNVSHFQSLSLQCVKISSHFVKDHKFLHLSLLLLKQTVLLSTVLSTP